MATWQTIEDVLKDLEEFSFYRFEGVSAPMPETLVEYYEKGKIGNDNKSVNAPKLESLVEYYEKEKISDDNISVNASIPETIVEYYEKEKISNDSTPSFSKFEKELSEKETKYCDDEKDVDEKGDDEKDVYETFSEKDDEDLIESLPPNSVSNNCPEQEDLAESPALDKNSELDKDPSSSKQETLPSHVKPSFEKRRPGRGRYFRHQNKGHQTTPWGRPKNLQTPHPCGFILIPSGMRL